ncbi:hypothetical protein BS78_10G129300 [Paspalum vaginatum]|nr:hypothetical protein BS78_10G129300 [Paspalum vaginatum]
METPWVILGRVVCGFPAPFDVDAEAEHTAAAAVDEAAVAQEEEEDAAADEAEVAQEEEEHAAAAAVDEAEVAQEDHAAAAAVDEEEEVQPVAEHVADVNEEAGVKAEHFGAVDEEAEVQAAADLDVEAVLQAVAGYVEDLDEETVVQAEKRAAAAARTDFTVPVSLERRVTALSAGRGAHPNPHRPDVYPYIIAAGTVFLLAHFSELPFYGTNFDLKPRNSHLVVARDFETAEGETTTASAERVPDRTTGFPALRSIKNVVFDTYYRGDDFLVGELIIPKDGHLATFVYLGPSTDYQWSETNVRYPLGDAGRAWIPHGAFVLDSRYWWFDLSWGILSLDPVYYRRAIPNLVFHELPGERALEEATPDIEMHRCITGSRNKVRYVEIVPDPEGEAATVAMWSLSRIPGAPFGSPGWRWDDEYAMNLEDIWNDDSYFEAQLPREVPVIAVVCPSDPDLIYFALEHHLFGVNVPQHRVVHSEGYELVNILGLDNPHLAFGRYVLAWSLPPEVIQGKT